MTVEIIDARKITDEGGEFWAVWLEITQVGQTWPLPTTAPGTLAKADLQAYFNAREADLWQVAQAKQYVPDVFKRLPNRRLLKAVAAVMRKELNILRQLHSLPDRTAAQTETAIKAELKQQ